MLENENTPVSNEEAKPAEEVKEETAPVEEAPKNEKKANKAKEEKAPTVNVDEKVPLVPTVNKEETIAEIENRRKALLDMFKKAKNLSRIVTLVVVVAVIGAIILIFNESNTLKIIGYALSGAVIAGMVVYYILTKDKFPRASKSYIQDVTGLINSYDFDDPRFSDLDFYPNKKLNKTDLDVDRVYKNTNEIGSRNFISGKFNKEYFEISENVLYNATGNKKSPRSVAFLGKYISLKNNLKFSGRYIFNIKGNPDKLVDQPNDTEDLKVVIDEPGFTGYASNEKPLKDVFGTKFLASIRNIQTDDKLLNCVIVVWAGHTGIYLSYDDSVTVLPFEHEFNFEAQNKFKNDLIQTLELAQFKK